MNAKALATQTCYRRYKACQHRLLVQSATTIQAAYRRHRRWQRVKLRRSRDRNDKAIIIQRSLREWNRRKARAKLVSAIVIQRYYQRSMKRKVEKDEKDTLSTVIKSIIVIQSRARARPVFQGYTYLRRCVIMVQSVIRMGSERKR